MTMCIAIAGENTLDSITGPVNVFAIVQIQLTHQYIKRSDEVKLPESINFLRLLSYKFAQCTYLCHSSAVKWLIDNSYE